MAMFNSFLYVHQRVNVSREIWTSFFLAPAAGPKKTMASHMILHQKKTIGKPQNPTNKEGNLNLYPLVN